MYAAQSLRRMRRRSHVAEKTPIPDIASCKISGGLAGRAKWVMHANCDADDLVFGMTGTRTSQMPAVVIDMAITTQLVLCDSCLRLLRVSVPALLVATALEDGDLPMAAMRSSADTAPLVGLQVISVFVTTTSAALSSYVRRAPCAAQSGGLRLASNEDSLIIIAAWCWVNLFPGFKSNKPGQRNSL